MLSSHGQDKNFLILSDLNSVSGNDEKSGIFELIYSAQLKQQNNSDSHIAVYYHPCNQNTNNHFGPLKQEEIRKLTFVIVSKPFFANRTKQADPFVFLLSPLREFSFIFRCKVCSAAGENIKKLEILPRLHFKGQKVLNDRMKLENNKATPS